MWNVRIIKHHSTFILSDRKHPSQFKIGLGEAPATAAKEEARRRHGSARNAARNVQVHTVWKFRSYHAALHVEQALIEMLRRFDYPEADKTQWFDVDPDSLTFFIGAVSPLVDAIHQAENHLELVSPALNPDKPYGKYQLQQTLRRFSDKARAGGVDRTRNRVGAGPTTAQRVPRTIRWPEIQNSSL